MHCLARRNIYRHCKLLFGGVCRLLKAKGPEDNIWDIEAAEVQALPLLVHADCLAYHLRKGNPIASELLDPHAHARGCELEVKAHIAQATAARRDEPSDFEGTIGGAHTVDIAMRVDGQVVDVILNIIGPLHPLHRAIGGRQSRHEVIPRAQRAIKVHGRQSLSGDDDLVGGAAVHDPQRQHIVHWIAGEAFRPQRVEVLVELGHEQRALVQAGCGQ